MNGLKRFASEGGRIVVVGENLDYMEAEGIAAENLLLQRFGAQLTNEGANLLCTGTEPAIGTTVSEYGGQVTATITRCSSRSWRASVERLPACGQ